MLLGPDRIRGSGAGPTAMTCPPPVVSCDQPDHADKASLRLVRSAGVDLGGGVVPDTHARDPLPYEAAFLAGKSFVAYRRRGGRRVTPLPDFCIGAHAAVAGYQLLTRDARRYRTHFPRLALIAP